MVKIDKCIYVVRMALRFKSRKVIAVDYATKICKTALCKH